MQQSSITKPILLACLFSYASFMYWIISAANTNTTNSLLSLSGSIPYGDKIGHFFVMGLLALMVNLLLNSRYQLIGKRNFLLGSLIVGAIVTTEEIMQIFIPSRTFCTLDLVADYAGIILIGRLPFWFRRPLKSNLLWIVQHRIRRAFYRGSKRMSLMFAGRQA